MWENIVDTPTTDYRSFHWHHNRQHKRAINEIDEAIAELEEAVTCLFEFLEQHSKKLTVTHREDIQNAVNTAQRHAEELQQLKHSLALMFDEHFFTTKEYFRYVIGNTYEALHFNFPFEKLYK